MVYTMNQIVFIFHVVRNYLILKLWAILYYILILNYYTNLPNILEERKIKDGNILYSRKYKKYYKKYDTILNNYLLIV